jgi:hypothetical protein
MNKLHKKDFTIAFKTGSDANKSKFKKEAVQGEMYFATDSKKLYVAETTAGTIDATLAQFNLGVFDSSLTFPTIQVFDNESDFITSTDAPDYTIVHAKDTDNLYVWDGNAWYKFQNN